MSAGYDISAASSDSTTQGIQLGSGQWIVGGNKDLIWLPLSLVALGALGLWLWFKKKGN